ncbi:hypothetical protein BO78DRAFT_114906 [Aspergillus sclerotiicarbonarius CBS 121057]|uniref:Uncharacterized protein n=1 Tax=Aspergillus sclerotiicarbonarius (strain CBS 121057 / IBT 28362) TaxID=1448318 RepID=A0A319EFE5_ASPSB|nr:hypothetical protein BO78DRAFT_114906 [Aspergillus sclerotiicarbonarius CBS 121057]
MSASSGLRGTCDVCLHANNEHNTAPCPVPRCKNRWKQCQVTGGCFKRSNNWSRRMCYACKAHPAVKDDLDFGAQGQRDVTRAQRADYKDTGTAGGDTSSGEMSSPAPSSPD